MGRHSKAVAEFWVTIREIEERKRQFEDWAADLPDDQKRMLHRAHALKRQAAIDAGRFYIPKRPDYLRNLTCGARTRSGQPCRMTALFPNGRCIWHGGKSTGPKTKAGRERALENLKLGRLKRGKSRD
ncbi:MAG: HGGxSTG domain-containing protein [Novosphingobium sp.]